jgi:hypothetical protein
MSAKKMLVVHLARTNAVLGVATRRTAGVPPVGDLVGAALLARTTQESGVAVAADELAVKEVDYSDDVVRQPMAHVVDASGAVVTAAQKVQSMTNSNLEVALTVSAAPAADKPVLIVIDGGANHDSLKFVGKTAAAATFSVAVSGVPPGAHVVLASVDGYAPLVDTRTFT